MKLREWIERRKFGRKMNPNNSRPVAGFFVYRHLRLADIEPARPYFIKKDY